MMPFAAHKELSESTSSSTSFPPYDSCGVSLKWKKVQSCLRVFGDRVSNVQALFLPIYASLCYELVAALVGDWFDAHGDWVSGWGTVIPRPASRGFWFPVHPVLTANLVLGSSWGWRELDLRASGKRAAWPSTCWTFLRRKKIEHFNSKTR
jgi:hypothetical protein